MDIGIVSARYAKALLKFAQDHGQMDEVYQSMSILKESFSSVPKLKATLSDPVLENEKKFRILSIAAGKDVPSCLERFFRMVLEKSRIELMPFMAVSYIKAYRKQKNLILCQLTVPRKFSESTIGRIKAIVEGKTKKEVEFSIKIDPSIIGGFVLEYDAHCLDASVRGQLRAISKHIV